MEQIKIGKFIASCRKEQGMTQAVLAEKLGISDRAVSKWETGKSMPDSGIMLELCELLKINVNELLSGEHITMEDYNAKSEEVILGLKSENEKYAKRLLRSEAYIVVVGVVASLAMIIAGTIIALKNGENDPLAVVLIVSGCVIVVAAALIGLGIEVKTGYYECAECGHIYKPSSLLKTAFAIHMNTTRYMKCPKCGKRCWQKKVLTKDE
ncbi:dNA-binding protein [[Eubacterium] siraeum CAG:80]|uniref:DNA-binding protein n=1 Tax=[Eubacterium] siraeum CAG:80 TaxID=1263080 RepID=R6RSV4_9FIRM|nr:dNA-binding protein [[Eubacterium] siraeum CAG:80]